MGEVDRLLEDYAYKYIADTGWEDGNGDRVVTNDKIRDILSNCALPPREEYIPEIKELIIDIMIEEYDVRAELV